MNEKILINFKKSYVLVIIAIIVSLILTYLDSKFTDKEVTKKDYIKSSLIIGIISTFIIYIHNIQGKLEEEVLSGPPPF